MLFCVRFWTKVHKSFTRSSEVRAASNARLRSCKHVSALRPSHGTRVETGEEAKLEARDWRGVRNERGPVTSFRAEVVVTKKRGGRERGTREWENGKEVGELEVAAKLERQRGIGYKGNAREEGRERGPREKGETGEGGEQK